MKTHTQFIYVFAFTLIGLFAPLTRGWARTRGAADYSLSNHEREAAKKIRNIFAKYTYTLGREMATFHYQSAESPESYRPGTLNDLLQTSAVWGAGFFDLNTVGSDAVGPGHYVATDPTGSRTFGGIGDPQLYVAVLRKNAKLLDLRNYLDDNDSSFGDLKNELSCLPPVNDSSEPQKTESDDRGGSLEKWFAFFRKSPTPSCRKVIIEALADLDVVAALYEYGSANDLANCRHDRGEALLIVSPDAFDPNQIAYFSNINSFDPNSIGGILRRLYEEGFKDYSMLLGSLPGMTKIPLTLSNQTSEPSQYEAWKKSYLYKCGPAWKNQQSKYSVWGALHAMRNPEIGALKVQLSNAYAKRKTGMPLSFSSMRGYQAMSASLAGVELEVWHAALKRFENSDDSDWLRKLADTSKILGEKNKISAAVDFSKKEPLRKALLLLGQLQTNPHLVFSGFAKMGVGPRMTLLFVNQFLTDLNSTPFVIGPLPLRQEQNFSRAMLKYKDAYISYLRSCLGQYLNEQINSNQIDSGLCGSLDVGSNGDSSTNAVDASPSH